MIVEHDLIESVEKSITKSRRVSMTYPLMSSSSVRGPFSESGIDAELRSLYGPRPTRFLAMSKIFLGVARNRDSILRSSSRKLAIQVSLSHPDEALTAHEQ